MKLNRQLKSSGKSSSRDNPNRRHDARAWAVGLRQSGSRICVCVIFERGVSYKMPSLGYGRNERCDASGEQHNVGWYNVADTKTFTRVSVSAFSITFPNSLTLLQFSLSFRDYIRSRFIPHRNEPFILLEAVSCRPFSAVSTNSVRNNPSDLPGIDPFRLPCSDHCIITLLVCLVNSTWPTLQPITYKRSCDSTNHLLEGGRGGGGGGGGT